MYDITKEDVENRVNKIHDSIVDTFTRHNNASYSIFNTISKFSELLPESLNKIVKLSDQITDALVVSGRTSLSKSILNLTINSSTLNLNRDDGSLTLKYRDKNNYTISSSKSYITTDNKYTILNSDNSSLSSFDQLLKGDGINITTEDQYFSFTFCLGLEEVSTISCVSLQLNKSTDSYPLVSEIYYISENNKKVYATILNSSDTKYDLDSNRQSDNLYNLLLPNIKTKKLYITLEDRNKTNLIIDSLKLKQLEYEDDGEIIVGPVTSVSPLLKASIEATGDSEYANYYISTDKNQWYEIINPTEISFDEDLRKVFSMNTVSNQSLKSNTDFKEIYLKINLKKILNKEKSSVNKIRSDQVSSSTSALKETQKQVTLYKSNSNVYYGDSTSTINSLTKDAITSCLSYGRKGNNYFVKSFIDNDYSIGTNTSTNDLYLNNKGLKIGGENILANKFNPYFSNVFGYSVSSSTRTINTKTDSSNVFLMDSKYSKDTYLIRQSNKEISLDFSLGYISSCLEAICSVEEDKEVTLYDSTYTEIKKLSIRKNGSFSYIDLISEGMFVAPTSELELNTLYPLILNTSNNFSLLDNKIYCSKAVITLNNIGKLYKEKLDFEINLSKENGNSIYVTESNMLNKYTESNTEVIKAYNENRVIKLKNKHIKKGSVTLRLAND